MTIHTQSQTPNEIYKIIEQHHDWRTVHARLSLDLKIIEEDKANLTRKVSFKMYGIYEEFEALDQSSQIPAAVSIEVCTYTLVWETEQDYEKMTEPKDSELNDFDCDTYVEWDSPNLPKELLENAFGKMHVDDLQLTEDLIEYYNSLEEVKYEDLPKSLKPLIEANISEYKRYNKFYGYPKEVAE